MKKRAFLLVCLLVVLILSLAGCGQKPVAQDTGKETVAGGQKPVELKFAHFFPATHPVETQIVQPWAKAVEEATGGMVKVKSYPGETLLKAAETYDGVVNGIADVGLSFFSYNRGRFPMMEIFEQPGIVVNNGKVAAKVSTELIKEYNPKEIQDTKLLMVSCTGPAYIATKNPVTKLEDLKGVQLRTTGLSAKVAQSLGAVPVAMPMSDAYEAISKGVAQGIIAPTEALQGYKLGEVTGNVTETNFLYRALYYITMNKDVWDSLPAETQQAIETASEKFNDEVVSGLFDKLNDDGLKYAVDNNGVKVHTLSDEETARWIKLVEAVQAESAAEVEKQGLPAKELLEKVKELAEKYNEVYQ